MVGRGWRGRERKERDLTGSTKLCFHNHPHRAYSCQDKHLFVSMETSRYNGIPYPVNIQSTRALSGPPSPSLLPFRPPSPLLPLTTSPSPPPPHPPSPRRAVIYGDKHQPSRMRVCSLSNSTSQPPSILCSTFSTCRMFSDIHTSSVTV